MGPLSVLIPFQPSNAHVAEHFANELAPKAQVILSGWGAPPKVAKGVTVLRDRVGKGRAIREALAEVRGDITVIQDPERAYSTAAYSELCAPIQAGVADAVFGTRVSRAKPLHDRALSSFTRLVADTHLSDPLSGQRAFRTEVLKGLTLTSEGSEVDPELVVKLAAQLYRLAEVDVTVESFPKESMANHLRRASTLFRYATLVNDSDNQHEGYNTLARMESNAPNYNRWLGEKFRSYSGRRVLEVGAGIGTITQELESERDLVIALEVDNYYVERLKNRFRDKPHVRPYLSGVERADWEKLAKEKIDTIVLSNVLEHIEDDSAAVDNFARVLVPGGRLLILVPALPALYGGIDEAVGHFRRYTKPRLTEVLEKNNFEIERMEWMNLVGIPGWFLNSRLLKKRALPAFQLRLYDQLAPILASVESRLPYLPIGMSLFAVARRVGESR